MKEHCKPVWEIVFDEHAGVTRLMLEDAVVPYVADPRRRVTMLATLRRRWGKKYS